MHLVYYDEAGDDGYPTYSSPLFVLTAVYLEHLTYKSCFEQLKEFRQDLQESFGFPVSMEMHTKDFLTDKNPYTRLQIAPADRITIINQFCHLIGALGVKIIDIVIVKPRILKPTYDVLDTAFKFSLQRVENDLNKLGKPDERFMIITDEGRLPSMRKITRQMQKVNFVPSMYRTQPRRLEITKLVEEPLPKDSKESYFIQLADLVSYVVYIYSAITTGVARPPNRLTSYVSDKQINDWMDMLKPGLNLKACLRDPYGVKYHPAA